MRYQVEYDDDGKRRTKSFDTEEALNKFCEKLNRMVAEDKCGGYLVLIKRGKNNG